MKIDVVTIFPEICEGVFGESILRRAQEAGKVEIAVHDLRGWTEDKHRRVDDEPYGGGPGMVMKPEPFFAAVEALRTDGSVVVLMTPQGARLDQRGVEAFAQEQHVIVLCGHYEGVDQRVIDALVDREVSIGDYVLTNGAVAANVLVDAVVRLLPGVLGDERSPEEESFSEAAGGMLEAPCYTRPAEFRGMTVPDVLLGGHHGKIEAWKREKSLEKTRRVRPDLVDESDRPSD